MPQNGQYLWVFFLYSTNYSPLLCFMCRSVMGTVTKSLTNCKQMGPTKAALSKILKTPVAAKANHVTESKNKLGCLEVFHKPL